MSVPTTSYWLRIRALRWSAGLTREQLATRTNLPRSRLADLEEHKAQATTRELWAVATALGVPVARLFNFDVPNERWREGAENLEEIVARLQRMTPDDLRCAMRRILQLLREGPDADPVP